MRHCGDCDRSTSGRCAMHGGGVLYQYDPGLQSAPPGPAACGCTRTVACETHIAWSCQDCGGAKCVCGLMRREMEARSDEQTALVERDQALALERRWADRVKLVERRAHAAAVILDGRCDDLLDAIAERGR